MNMQKKYFKKNFLSAVGIKNRNNIVLVSEEPLKMADPFELREFDIIQYMGDDFANPDNWRSRRLGSDVKIHIDWLESQNWLVVTFFGSVLLMGKYVIKRDKPTGNKIEKNIPGNSAFGRLRNLKVIDGEAYMVAMHREVMRRDGPNNWVALDKGIKRPSKKITGGFQDIAGLAKDNLYAVGHDADCWHYNGEEWQQLEMPTNADFYSVTCGNDGNVYISTGNDTIVMGNGVRWKVIKTGLDNVKFRHILWFKDRVFLPAGSTLYQIKDGEFEVSELNDIEKHPERPVSWSFMDSNSEHLLIGTQINLCLWDGEHFETVIPYENPKFSDEEQAELNEIIKESETILKESKENAKNLNKAVDSLHERLGIQK
jgi:hypothetical protein